MWSPSRHRQEDAVYDRKGEYAGNLALKTQSTLTVHTKLKEVSLGDEDTYEMT